jgi:hypothetical protein
MSVTREIARAFTPPGLPAARPVALVGQGPIIDACAQRLLGTGERRLLAPLQRPVTSELARCSVVIACGLTLADARIVASARRPWVAVIDHHQDRYGYGTLPRLGAQNVLRLDADGAVPATLAERVVAVGDDAEMIALARRLPPLAAPLARRLARRVGTRTLAAALLGSDTNVVRAHLDAVRVTHQLAAADPDTTSITAESVLAAAFVTRNPFGKRRVSRVAAAVVVTVAATRRLARAGSLRSGGYPVSR